MWQALCGAVIQSFSEFDRRKGETSCTNHQPKQRFLLVYIAIPAGEWYNKTYPN